MPPSRPVTSRRADRFLLCWLLAVAALPALDITAPPAGTVFTPLEITVDDPALAALTSPAVFDAYDADGDGRSVQLDLLVEQDGADDLRMPGFALRQAADGPWSWRIRYSPLRAGQQRLTAELTIDGQTRRSATVALPVSDDEAGSGFLQPPGSGDNPAYLRRLQADGSSRAEPLFGAWRAWTIDPQPNDAPGWLAHEWIDPERELLPVLRQHGYNLLGQWMAPWEYQLLHHDRAEYWRADSGHWQRHPLPDDQPWSPWQHLDQGRAAAFDRWLAACQGDEHEAMISLLFTPIPHLSLQMRNHPWGHSGWSPDATAGDEPQKHFGLSAHPEANDSWAYCRAPVTSGLWKAQCNLHRYLIARWGASPAIGVWVLMDELDGIGDRYGSMRLGLGWWSDPAHDDWLRRTIACYRQLDPYHRPIHCATTSFGLGNHAWPSGPSPVDLVGWHWYPRPAGLRSYAELWRFVDAGLRTYAASHAGRHPFLVSEFGAAERASPDQQPGLHEPTLYHHGIWAGLLSGAAGTPLDWDDGKEYGELRWRERPGAFDRQHYPIDHAGLMPLLQAFLADCDWETARPLLDPSCPIAITSDGQTIVHALASDDQIHGWVLASQAPTLSLSGLTAGTWQLRCYDTWSGDWSSALSLTVAADGQLQLPIMTAWDARAGQRQAIGERSQRGHDLAFQLRYLP